MSTILPVASTSLTPPMIKLLPSCLESSIASGITPLVSIPLTWCLDCSFFTLNTPFPAMELSPITTIFLFALFVFEKPPMT